MPFGNQGFVGGRMMRKIFYGAVVASAALLSEASLARADEKPAAPTTPAPTVQNPPVTETPAPQGRTGGTRTRREGGPVYRQRGGRKAAFVQNLRNRRSGR